MADRREVRSFIETWRLLVMRDPTLLASAKVNAVVISSCAKIDVAELHFQGSVLTADIYPGLDWIAQRSGQSRRTAAQGIAMLKKSGRMTWRRRSQNSNTYSLILVADVQHSSHQADGDMKPVAHCEVQDVAQQVGTDVQYAAHESSPDVQNTVARCAESGVTTCDGLHTNLGSIQEENLFGDLQREIGPGRWHQHIWDGAIIVQPKTVQFRSRKHLEFALKHYQSDFERLQWQAIARSAA